MTFEVVGGQQELAAVAAFLDETREAPAALVLEGEVSLVPAGFARRIDEPAPAGCLPNG